MITVQEFKEAGFKILPTDRCRAKGDFCATLEYQYLKGTNYDKDLLVVKVDWRENTAKQPVPDDVNIITLGPAGYPHFRLGSTRTWGKLDVFTKWKPNIEALERKKK